MITDVLNAIDELYIQEAECEMNACIEMAKEYDKMITTQESVYISTQSIYNFFQEGKNFDAFKKDVKRQNRGKSTINKILFIIPRMIVSFIKLITGQLKKVNLPSVTQVNELGELSKKATPFNIKISKQGTALNIAAVVGGSLTLAAIGTTIFYGFRKSGSKKSTTNIGVASSPDELSSETPTVVIEPESEEEPVKIEMPKGYTQEELLQAMSVSYSEAVKELNNLFAIIIDPTKPDTDRQNAVNELEQLKNKYKVSEKSTETEPLIISYEKFFNYSEEIRKNNQQLSDQLENLRQKVEDLRQQNDSLSEENKFLVEEKKRLNSLNEELTKLHVENKDFIRAETKSFGKKISDTLKSISDAKISDARKEYAD